MTQSDMEKTITAPNVLRTYKSCTSSILVYPLKNCPLIDKAAGMKSTHASKRYPSIRWMLSGCLLIDLEALRERLSPYSVPRMKQTYAPRHIKRYTTNFCPL